MKRLICSAAVASALLAATAIPSGANTVNLGDIPPTATIGGNSSVATTYDTTWTFTLPTAEDVKIQGSEFDIAPFTLTGLTFSITSLPAPTLGSLSNFTGAGTLAAGTYNLLVSGTGGSIGSLYSGTITGTAVTATPIPGALALFASGLGLLGFWGRNKRRKAGSGSASLEAVAC